LGQLVTDVLIDRLKEEDKERYVEVLVESYAQYEKHYPSKEAWQDYISDIRNSVNHPHSAEIFVAKKGEDILGGLQLFIGSGNAYNRPELEIDSTIVRLLGIHPKARGLGIAKKLLDKSVEFARARGDEYLYLHSTDMMEAAIKLYIRFGFVRDERKDFQKNNFLVKAFKYKL